MEQRVHDPEQQFVIVHLTAPDADPIVLRSVGDADAATVAFADALQRLRAKRARGEVLVYTEAMSRIVLRQALRERRSERGA